MAPMRARPPGGGTACPSSPWSWQQIGTAGSRRSALRPRQCKAAVAGRLAGGPWTRCSSGTSQPHLDPTVGRASAATRLPPLPPPPARPFSPLRRLTCCRRCCCASRAAEEEGKTVEVDDDEEFDEERAILLVRPTCLRCCVVCLPAARLRLLQLLLHDVNCSQLQW